VGEKGAKTGKSGKRWLKKGKSGVKWGIKRAQKSAANLGKGAQKMFLGTHEPRLDDKGRLILPAKFREELAAGLVITKGQERCLYVFPSNEFSVITETVVCTTEISLPALLGTTVPNLTIVGPSFEARAI